MKWRVCSVYSACENAMQALGVEYFLLSALLKRVALRAC